MRTNVDLPAPFSPTSARTSPAVSVKSTPRTAWIPPNRLARPRASRSGAIRSAAARSWHEGARLVIVLGVLTADHLGSQRYELLHGLARDQVEDGLHCLLGPMAIERRGLHLPVHDLLDGVGAPVRPEELDAPGRDVGVLRRDDGAEGHLVVMGENGVDLVGMGLQVVL